jgi:hypothetical protein
MPVSQHTFFYDSFKLKFSMVLLFRTIVPHILLTSEFKFKGGHPVVGTINTIKLIPSDTTCVYFIIVLKYFYNSNMFQPK